MSSATYRLHNCSTSGPFGSTLRYVVVRNGRSLQLSCVNNRSTGRAYDYVPVENPVWTLENDPSGTTYQDFDSALAAALAVLT